MSDDKKELAKQYYLQGYKYQQIADELDIKLSTIKSWVKREWSEDKKLQKKSCKNDEIVAKKVETKNTASTRKKGGQPGNKNATGPPRNQHAVKHGLFSKFLPPETLEIMKMLNDGEVSYSPLDIIWNNILLQQSAILRAQEIMYVEDKEDLTTTRKSQTDGDTSMSVSWQVQQAWDKQATFINAQARASSELRSLIKQYDEMLNKNWELATEEQRARIEHIKSKTLKAEDDNLQYEKIDELIKSIDDAVFQ